MKKTLLAAVVASSVFSVAYAANNTSEEGFYIGGGVGASKSDNVVGATANDKSDTGFKVFGGYQFNKNLGAELGYIDFGKFRFTNAGNTFDLKGKAVYLSAVGTLPINEQFDLQAKLGYANEDVSTNNSKISITGDGSEFHFGAAARYHFNPQTAVSLDYDTAGSDLNLWSVNVNYKF